MLGIEPMTFYTRPGDDNQSDILPPPKKKLSNRRSQYDAMSHDTNDWKQHNKMPYDAVYICTVPLQQFTVIVSL